MDRGTKGLRSVMGIVSMPFMEGMLVMRFVMRMVVTLRIVVDVQERACQILERRCVFWISMTVLLVF